MSAAQTEAPPLPAIPQHALLQHAAGDSAIHRPATGLQEASPAVRQHTPFQPALQHPPPEDQTPSQPVEQRQEQEQEQTCITPASQPIASEQPVNLTAPRNDGVEGSENLDLATNDQFVIDLTAEDMKPNILGGLPVASLPPEPQAQSRLGVMLRDPLFAENAPPVPSQKTQVPAKATRSRPTIISSPNMDQLKMRFPTIVQDPDSNGFAEVCCPFCGANCSTQGKFIDGVNGLKSHIALCHGDGFPNDNKWDRAYMIRQSMVKKLTASQVNAMLSEIKGAHTVRQVNSKGSVLGSKIRVANQLHAGTKLNLAKNNKVERGLTRKQSPKKSAQSDDADFIDDGHDADVHDGNIDEDPPTKKQKRAHLGRRGERQAQGRSKRPCLQSFERKK